MREPKCVPTSYWPGGVLKWTLSPECILLFLWDITPPHQDEVCNAVRSEAQTGREYLLCSCADLSKHSFSLQAAFTLSAQGRRAAVEWSLEEQIATLCLRFGHCIASVMTLVCHITKLVTMTSAIPYVSGTSGYQSAILDQVFTSRQQSETYTCIHRCAFNIGHSAADPSPQNAEFGSRIGISRDA